MVPALNRPVLPHERRSPERLRAHWTIETALAERLRSAGKEERRRLYPEVYDELFRSVPDHPQLTDQLQPDRRAAVAAGAARRLAQFLGPASTFLEIGSGDLALALHVAPRVGHVYAVDVSIEIAQREELPANVDLVLSDGSSIPVPHASVDLAYSNQLMEHLHADDALDQLRNIVQALKPGGRYLCLTPSRLSGPHDISMYFSDEPTGLHLVEYTTTDLVRMFRAAGFSRVGVPVPIGGRFVVVPAVLAMAVEAVLLRLPRRIAGRLARLLPIRALLNRVIATR
jgi:SAM-dependent methyltransferase